MDPHPLTSDGLANDQCRNYCGYLVSKTRVTFPVKAGNLGSAPEVETWFDHLGIEKPHGAVRNLEVVAPVFDGTFDDLHPP